MQQTHADLTISDVLSDPLILAVARADGVSAAEFSTLLYSTAERLRSKVASKTTAHYSSVPAISGPRRKLQTIIHPLATLHDNNCAACS